MRDCPGHRGRRIGHYVISEQPLAADEWAAERAAQIEAPTIVNRTDGKSRNRTSPLIAHYILSDKPMTEQEWIEARAEYAKPVTTVLPQDGDDTAKLLE
jgi:hypothetical protein